MAKQTISNFELQKVKVNDEGVEATYYDRLRPADTINVNSESEGCNHEVKSILIRVNEEAFEYLFHNKKAQQDLFDEATEETVKEDAEVVEKADEIDTDESDKN